MSSEQTLEAPRVEVPVARSSADRRAAPALRDFAYRWRWILGALALLVIAAIIVLVAGTRPGYDPYGWLAWGKLTIHWKLDTNGAPSWKPLPFLFTVPYAVVGHYAMWLWMVTAVAVSLSGAVFAWRIAFRLTGATPERRYAAYAAGAFAAVAVFGIQDYTHYVLSAQSDTMIVSFCLAAIDFHLSGRHRWAFWMWVLGSLGRPEVWPFLAACTVWAWRSNPQMRRMLIAGVLLIPLLWFGIPALTANSFFVAGNNALHSPRELHQGKVIGTIDRLIALNEAPVWIAALLASALALYRRERKTLMLAAGVVVWGVVEIAFSLHGWPALPRYLFEAAAAACVLAGVFVGWLILAAPATIARLASGLGPRVAGRLGAWGTVLVVAALVGSMIPPAHSRYVVERRDIRHEHMRAKQLDQLRTVIDRLGAARIFACGQPNIPIGYQSAAAWYMDVKVGVLYVLPSSLAQHPHPLVNILPTHRGWRVFPSHVTATSPSVCRHLVLVYRS